MEHGGEYPDTMPQAIKLIDAEGLRRTKSRRGLSRANGGLIDAAKLRLHNFDS
jgi:hypothetical protein